MIARIPRFSSLLLSALALFCLPLPAIAHHSIAGFFDANTQVEIAGVISRVRWRNPHTVFIVDVTNDDGSVTEWKIESGALGVLRSRGLARQFAQVGDDVKILGDKSLRGRPEMFARNMLLANGQEVLLTVPSKAYFSLQQEGGLLEAEFDPEVVAAARANANGIFRVWSTNFAARRRGPRPRMFTGGYPLKPEAKAIQEQYDAGDTALLGCFDWTMPRLMANPLPVEFIDQGNSILVKFEENDERRVIYLDDTEAPDELTHMGFSTGRWENGALIVETTGITPERLDNLGTPFSDEIRLLETFTVVDDGNQLNYNVQVSDPNTFTESFEESRFWEWRPEIVVGAYICEQDQNLQ